MEIGALPIPREIEEPEGYVLTPRDKDLRHSVFGLVAIIPRRLPRKNEDILNSTTAERRISMKSVQLQHKRSLINGKTIVGIDPAKTKHQAAVIDTLLTGHVLTLDFRLYPAIDGGCRR